MVGPCLTKSAPSGMYSPAPPCTVGSRVCSTRCRTMPPRVMVDMRVAASNTCTHNHTRPQLAHTLREAPPETKPSSRRSDIRGL